MFELISSIFNLLIYQPLLNALFVLYKYLPGNDFGMAIIILTFGVRFLLYPLSRAAIKSQRALSELQPKIKEIQERFKNDLERQTKETLALYREAKVNPFASVLPFLVQLPVLIALFRIFGVNLMNSNWFGALYPFLEPPGHIDFTFLGMFNLGEPNILFALGAGILQFVQTKIPTPSSKESQSFSQKKEGQLDFSQLMQKQMLYFFPVFTFIILLKLPSALGLYWAATTAFSIGQQYFTLKENKKI